MEFIEAMRKGETVSFLSGISRVFREQDDHFQQIARNLQIKFEELKYFDNSEFELNDVKRNAKEPKRKRAGGAEMSKLIQNYSVCTTDLKEPLGSSTPTETSTFPRKEDCVKEPNATSEPNDDTFVVAVPKSKTPPKTPPNEVRCPLQSESVKKRIAEFEKRAAVASSASKIPVLTPVKKNFVVHNVSQNVTVKITKEERVKPPVHVEKKKERPAKTTIYVEKAKEVPTNPRLTRNNSKILQEKNTNIKTLREKAIDPPAKKMLVKKTSADETGRKKEEVSQNVTSHKETTLEKQKRCAAMRERREKEQEAKLQAVAKVKEEKLLLLKKKALETVKMKEANVEKPREKIQESYNIDDVVDGAGTDEEDNPTNKIPSWAMKENRKRQLCAQAWLDKQNTVYLWFHNRLLKYPKVEELFYDGVETRPRTSSAMWNNSSICL